MLVGVLAGDGQVGWLDGPALEARFSEPFGLAVAADGSTFVTDAGNSHRLRRIGVDGHVSTLAGGERGFVDGRGPRRDSRRHRRSPSMRPVCSTLPIPATTRSAA